MRSTGDIQFFVCRSQIIPEPPFPSQGIAGSGNEIVFQAESKIYSDLYSRSKIEIEFPLKFVYEFGNISSEVLSRSLVV